MSVLFTLFASSVQAERAADAQSALHRLHKLKPARPRPRSANVPGSGTFVFSTTRCPSCHPVKPAQFTATLLLLNVILLDENPGMSVWDLSRSMSSSKRPENVSRLPFSMYNPLLLSDTGDVDQNHGSGVKNV